MPAAPSQRLVDFVTRIDSFLNQNLLWLYGVAALVALVPIWSFPYFPSLDGPAHLAIADIVVRYDSADAQIFREFYELNWRLIPNLFIFLVLVPLMSLVSPLVAHKILISLYVCLFMGALLYSAKSFGRGGAVLGLLGAPFAYNFALELGFYNFCFGLTFLLFTLGFWWRHRSSASWGVLMGYAALSGLTYLTHILAWACSVAAIGVAALTEFALHRRRPGGQFLERLDWRFLATAALLPALAYLPVAAHGAFFFATDTTGELSDDAPDDVLSIGVRLARLGVVGTVLLNNMAAIPFSIFFLVGLLGVVTLLVGGQRWTSAGKGLLYAWLFFLLLYVFVPYKFVMRWVPLRLEPVFWLLLVMWTASLCRGALPSRRVFARPLAVFISLVALLSIGAVNLRNHAVLNELISEFVSAGEYIAPQTVVLAVRLNESLEEEEPLALSGIFLQAMAYLSISRTAIDLDLYQAASDIFPARYRPQVNPYRFLAPDSVFVGAPLEIDFAGYESRIGRPVEYVLLWGDAPDLWRQQPLPPLLRRLEEDFKLSYTSQPTRRVHLYYRNR